MFVFSGVGVNLAALLGWVKDDLVSEVYLGWLFDLS